MRWFRFNIAGLLGFILVCGVAFAALKVASDLWESGVFTLTLVVLLVSLLLAIHRTGASRAFWVGFAIFGLSYLGLSLVPPIEARLITAKGLTFLHSKLPGQVPEGPILFTLSTTGSGSPGQPTKTVSFTATNDTRTTSGQAFYRMWDTSTGKLIGGWGSSTENFVMIGHSLLALLLACVGGLISQNLSRTSSPTEGSISPT